MIRVQDQREIHRPHVERIRLRPKEHPQEIFCVAARRIRLHRLAAVPDLLVGSHDGRGLRRHPGRFGDVGLA